jgi:uncharacterized membrane protein
MVVPFVIAAYVGALAADLAYAFGGQDMFFARGAFWLLGAGIVMSVPAAVLGLVDFLFEPAIRTIPHAWFHMTGNVVLTVIALVNWSLRYQMGAETGADAYWWLSAVSVALLLFNGWMGWEMVYRRHVGVSDTVP